MCVCGCESRTIACGWVSQAWPSAPLKQDVGLTVVIMMKRTKGMEEGGEGGKKKERKKRKNGKLDKPQ